MDLVDEVLDLLVRGDLPEAVRMIEDEELDCIEVEDVFFAMVFMDNIELSIRHAIYDLLQPTYTARHVGYLIFSDQTGYFEKKIAPNGWFPDLIAENISTTEPNDWEGGAAGILKYVLSCMGEPHRKRLAELTIEAIREGEAEGKRWSAVSSLPPLRRKEPPKTGMGSSLPCHALLSQHVGGFLSLSDQLAFIGAITYDPEIYGTAPEDELFELMKRASDELFMAICSFICISVSESISLLCENIDHMSKRDMDRFLHIIPKEGIGEVDDVFSHFLEGYLAEAYLICMREQRM